MMERDMSEQFRKSRNNYFKRGYQIGVKSDAKVFVLMERKGKFYTFRNTDRQFWQSQIDIVSRAIHKYPILLLIVQGPQYSHLKVCRRLQACLCEEEGHNSCSRIDCTAEAEGFAAQ